MTPLFTVLAVQGRETAFAGSGASRVAGQDWWRSLPCCCSWTPRLRSTKCQSGPPCSPIVDRGGRSGQAQAYRTVIPGAPLTIYAPLPASVSRLATVRDFPGLSHLPSAVDARGGRRVMPTLGHLARFEGRQLLALSDWTDSTHVAQKRSYNRAGRAEEARAAAPLSEPMPQMLNHSAT